MSFDNSRTQLQRDFVDSRPNDDNGVSGEYFTRRRNSRLCCCYRLVRALASFACRLVINVILRLRVLLMIIVENSFKLHRLFLHLNIVQTAVNQVVFFMLVEKVICPEKQFTYLFSLLLFHILVYVKRSLKERRWSQRLRVNNVHQFLRLTSTFVVLRITKGLVLTIVLMTLSMQMKKYEPNSKYLFITGSYYVTSFPDVQRRLSQLLRHLAADLLEGLEEFWSPVVIGFVEFFCSLVFTLLVLQRHPLLGLAASYTNLYLAYAQLSEKAFPALRRERSALSKFELIARRELERRNCDVTCAVCLEDMIMARITPCGHAFHGGCLRQWLKQSLAPTCPLCKRDV